MNCSRGWLPERLNPTTPCAALPFADVGVARVDHHRALRQGLPEAVYGPGKSPGDVAVIVAELLEGGIGPVVLTRADKAQVDAAMAVDDTATVIDGTAVWRRAAERSDGVVVATAGTADRPVADECAAVLWAHGVDPHRLHDVGVSGLHRLLADIDVLLDCDAVVVVAGTEGALASVVGGLTAAPVVAVPTSVGYGASLEGSRRCSACSPRAHRASPWSVSTTGSGLPVR